MAKMIQVEMYTEEDYDQMLDDVYPKLFGIPPSCILRELDPIAYDIGFNGFQEYEVKYVCPTCGELWDTEEDADTCCQENNEGNEE